MFQKIKMKRSFRNAVIILVFSLALAVDLAAAAPSGSKHIIFMVPDGMGMACVTAARIFKNGVEGPPLYLETLPQVGLQRTYSANSTITDSAAAASAWASGEKYRNGEISCHDGDGDGVCNRPVRPTILELSKAKGMATGLVATSTITQATPASWAAHVHSRSCESEIARQYVMKTGVDVLLGGGIGSDRGLKGCKTPSPLSAEELIRTASDELGYAYVQTKRAMNQAVSNGAGKILGLFAAGGKSPETFRVDASRKWNPDEPTLAEMTGAALKVLEKNEKGFFLMVEGSQIDWAGHANDLKYQVGEVLGFDAAVKVVLDWVNADPARKRNTLVIIAPDHETGGFAVNGPYLALSDRGDMVLDGWTTTRHTGADTAVWSQGPGSESLGGSLENTALYGAMIKVLNGD